MTSEKLETNATTENTGLKSEEKNFYSLDSTTSKKTLIIKFCNFFASLKIELVLFLFMFSFILNTTCLTNMMMDKGCLYYFKNSKNVCLHIFEHHDERNNVEILANNYNLYLDCLELIAAFIVTFIAPWSDKYSRKTPLIVALFGFFLSDIGIMLCTFYFSSSLDYIILSHLPTQLCGGFICAQQQ